MISAAVDPDPQFIEPESPCPCGCGRTVKPGRRFAIRGCSGRFGRNFKPMTFHPNPLGPILDDSPDTTVSLQSHWADPSGARAQAVRILRKNRVQILCQEAGLELGYCPKCLQRCAYYEPICTVTRPSVPGLIRLRKGKCLNCLENVKVEIYLTKDQWPQEKTQAKEEEVREDTDTNLESQTT